MDIFTPEVLKVLLEVGGQGAATILALMFAIKYLFNGRGERIDQAIDGLNEMKDTVKEGFATIHSDMKEMRAALGETRERVIRLEERERVERAKLEMLLPLDND